MLACAVWGSYLVIAAISYYSGGVLHYIVLNIIHRSYIPGYSEAYVIVPMNPVGKFDDRSLRGNLKKKNHV